MCWILRIPSKGRVSNEQVTTNRMFQYGEILETIQKLKHYTRCRRFCQRKNVIIQYSVESLLWYKMVVSRITDNENPKEYRVDSFSESYHEQKKT